MARKTSDAESSHQHRAGKAYYKNGAIFSDAVVDSVAKVLPTLGTGKTAIGLIPEHMAGVFSLTPLALRNQWTIIEANSASNSDDRNESFSLPVDAGSADLIVIFNFEIARYLENILIECHRCLGDDKHLLVVSSVGDDFADCFGLLKSARHNDKYCLPTPIKTDDIVDSARRLHFDVHAIDTISALYKNSLSAWYSDVQLLNKKDQISVRLNIASASRLMGGASPVLLDGNEISIYSRWVVCMSTKGDRRRHLVPAVAAAVLFRDIDGRRHILLQRRQREAEFWNNWELPQGHLRAGESFLDAAHRELSEEAGLVGTLAEKQPFFHISTRHDAYLSWGSHLAISSGAHKEFFCIAVCLNYVSGEAHSEERREFRWVDREQLNRLLASGKVFPLNEAILHRCVDEL
jgi:8-oxo-dGTP pyrophosphatase MutT (NUDIX family)